MELFIKMTTIEYNCANPDDDVVNDFITQFRVLYGKIIDLRNGEDVTLSHIGFLLSRISDTIVDLHGVPEFDDIPLVKRSIRYIGMLNEMFAYDGDGLDLINNRHVSTQLKWYDDHMKDACFIVNSD